MTSYLTISYWLVPANSEFKDVLKKAMNKLSKDWDSPKFEGHVTLHCVYDKITKEKAIQVLNKVANNNNNKISLTVTGISHSPVYFKTLFLEFQKNQDLDRLAKEISNELPSTYEFKPHLSLLYSNTISEKERETLCQELLPIFNGKQFLLDSLALVSPGKGRDNFDSVKDWEIIKIAKL